MCRSGTSRGSQALRQLRRPRHAARSAAAPTRPTVVETRWPPIRARGCAGSASGEPITSTIEVAKGMAPSGVPKAAKPIPWRRWPAPRRRRRQRHERRARSSPRRGRRARRRHPIQLASITAQTKRAADRSAALPQAWRSLLQVGHRRQVGRQLGDTGRTAPAGAEATRVDRGDVAGAGAGGR